MSDAQVATDAARSLARARWGDTRLRRAVELVSDRRDELDEALLERLREIAAVPAVDGGEER